MCETARSFVDQPVGNFPRWEGREARQAVLFMVVYEVFWDLIYTGERSCQSYIIPQETISNICSMLNSCIDTHLY